MKIMITFDELLARANALGNDATVWVHGNTIDVTLEDFDGFDANWEEVFREYDNPDAVADFLTWLKTNADRAKKNLYHYYYFGDTCVEVGWGSFDI